MARYWAVARATGPIAHAPCPCGAGRPCVPSRFCAARPRGEARSAYTDAVGITGIVLTKLDGTAKGGIALAIRRELGIPIKLVGLGETADDLVDFDPDEFVDALFD